MVRYVTVLIQVDLLFRMVTCGPLITHGLPIQTRERGGQDRKTVMVVVVVWVCQKSLVFSCFFIYHPQRANLILVFFYCKDNFNTNLMSSLNWQCGFYFLVLSLKFPSEMNTSFPVCPSLFSSFLLGSLLAQAQQSWGSWASQVCNSLPCSQPYFSPDFFSLFGEGVRGNVKCELPFSRRPKKAINVHSSGDRTLSQGLYKFQLGTYTFLCL